MARLAGIMGAKRTPDLIPLCHPIALHSVDGRADAATPTPSRSPPHQDRGPHRGGDGGLTAVAAAGLALVDMVKAVDPAASLDSVRVLRKEGGKTGEWVRPPERP